VSRSRTTRHLARTCTVGAVILALAVTAGARPASASAASARTLAIVAGRGSQAGPPTPGPATSSALDHPAAVAVDSQGNVYIADYVNDMVEEVTPGGILSVIAGTGTHGAPTPGSATSSDLAGPIGVAVDSVGNVFIADYGNCVIEEVFPIGTLSIFAGTGTCTTPTPGPAAASGLNGPNGVAVDSTGHVYIADSLNNVIEEVTSGGALSIIAGTGSPGAPTPGPATSSDLRSPTGVAVDPDGNVYVADHKNDVVEEVTLGGTLSIIAGTGSPGAPTPGPATLSNLDGPVGVAVDSSGTVTIGDLYNVVVEQVAPGGALSIIAGTGTFGTPTAGPATSSDLGGPAGVAVDSSGVVYVADYPTSVIVKVTPLTPSSPTIVNIPHLAAVGGSFSPDVTTTGDGARYVTSGTPSSCTVSGPVVSFVGIGTCSLTAGVTSGASYRSAVGTLQTFAVVAGCTAAGGGTDGYWLAGADGQVYPFGSAGDYGSLVSLGVTPSRPIVGIASTADCKGYWLVADDGGLFAFGDAHFYGSMGGMPMDAPVVGMTSTPQGGYYEVASDGGLFAFGPGAAFHGSMGGQPLAKSVVGMAGTPQGGYYEVASDGGLFAFGPGADFLGSMGGQRLNRPVVGMALDPTGGYYEVATDGGVFAFRAAYHGSTGCLRLVEPILAIVVSPDTTTVGTGAACGSTGQAPGGYQFVSRDGGVFSFGNATFSGSLGGSGIDDVVGLANS